MLFKYRRVYYGSEPGQMVEDKEGTRWHVGGRSGLRLFPSKDPIALRTVCFAIEFCTGRTRLIS